MSNLSHRSPIVIIGLACMLVLVALSAGLNAWVFATVGGGATVAGMLGRMAAVPVETPGSPVESAVDSSSSSPLWPETDFGNVCRDAFRPFPPGTSFQTVWDEVLGPRTRNTSAYLQEQVHQYYAPQNRSNAAETFRAFRRWVDDIFNFHTFERLRRSSMHPAPDASVKRLMEIVRRRRADPANNDPVRIMVLGGSVVEGTTCSMNQVGIPIDPEEYAADRPCSWPNRLEHLLNTVIFSRDGSENHPIFEVENAGHGGTNSRIGSLLLEYQLLPWVKDNVPDVVISSYSANDAMNPDEDETFAQDLPMLVGAAHRLRPCDIDLPLVVLADDLFGPEDRTEPAIHQTGTLYKTASWFNLMAVSYANVGRHQAASVFFNSTSINPMFGSKLGIHLGLGYHVAMAFTMLFNFASAMHAACDAAALEEQKANERPAKAKLELYEEPLAKDRGGYGPADTVRLEWENNVNERERMCQSATSTANVSGAPDSALSNFGRPMRPWSLYSSAVCEYAWLMTPQTDVFDADDMALALAPVMTRNVGWTAVNGWHRGWNVYYNDSGVESDDEAKVLDAGATNAPSSTNKLFEIEVPDVTLQTRFLTVVSMKSYSRKWIDSRLRVTVEVIPAAGSAEERGTASMASDIEGYHEIRTSVYFPHKFELPGGGARVGDTIHARFELVDGMTFKIGGIAFCR